MNTNKLLALLLSFFLCLPAYAGIGADGSGSGSGAASTESFITVGNSSSLANERAIAAGTGLTGTDGGANGSYTIGLGPVLSYFYNTGATTNQAAINAILGLSGLAAGDIIYYDGTNWSLKHKGANGTFLGIDGSGNLAYGSPSGSGTVTSVEQTVPSWLSVSGSPVTGSGTLAIANGTGLSNWYVVGTNGSGALDLRALDPSHIPSLDASKITSGSFAKAQQHTATVYKDAGNTYSAGAQDMSAAGVTFKIPTDAPASGGLIAYRSNKLAWHNGTTVINAANEARTISAGTGLSGGGDLSADRTISLSTVVETLGGTNQTTYSTGDMLYASGANTLAKRSIGSSGQVLTVSGGVPTWATPSSAGLLKAAAITSTARTLPTSGALSGTYIHSGNVTSTSTYTFAHDTRIYLKGDLTLGHTVTGTAQSNGGSPDSFYSIGVPGSGLSPGLGGSYQYGGGGGGACGGNGGRGATASTSPYESPAGGKATAVWGTGGSGGGSGAGSGTSGQPGQNGGGGGAFLYIEVDGNVTLNETISADGAAGTVASSTGGAGGGGSGGQIVIRCTGTLTLASGKKVKANGGNGGNYSASGNKGGGGGGGMVQTWSGGSTTLTGSLEAAAGTKGTGTAGAIDAADGSAGTTESIQNTAPISLF